MNRIPDPATSPTVLCGWSAHRRRDAHPADRDRLPRRGLGNPLDAGPGEQLVHCAGQRVHRQRSPLRPMEEDPTGHEQGEDASWGSHGSDRGSSTGALPLQRRRIRGWRARTGPTSSRTNRSGNCFPIHARSSYRVRMEDRGWIRAHISTRAWGPSLRRLMSRRPAVRDIDGGVAGHAHREPAGMARPAPLGGSRRPVAGHADGYAQPNAGNLSRSGHPLWSLRCNREAVRRRSWPLHTKSSMLEHPVRQLWCAEDPPHAAIPDPRSDHPAARPRS
jgi:hypothetical protein